MDTNSIAFSKEVFFYYVSVCPFAIEKVDKQIKADSKNVLMLVRLTGVDNSIESWHATHKIKFVFFVNLHRSGQ